MNKDFSNWRNYFFNQPNFPKIKNPSILAFSCYFHDSSACIIKNNKIIAAAEEERFTRRKHDPAFPINAINFCLESACLNEIDIVAFYENPDAKWERVQKTMKENPPELNLQKDINRLWKDIKSKDKIQEYFSQTTKLTNKIIFLDHHLSHAASSYFVSGFNESTLVTIDGVGEKITTSYGIASENDINLLQCINFPHSIGLLYTAITVHLGFRANSHEYKVMGLAPYGNMNRNSNVFYNKMTKLIDLCNDGSFFLNMDYFGHDSFGKKACSDKMCDLLGVGQNTKEGFLTSEHKDIAASLQMITEDSVINLLCNIHKKTKINRLCLAGGVALNSVINGKILSKTPFNEIFIQPAAGDSGTVIGAAKYIQHSISKSSQREHPKHSLFGPSFTNKEIKFFLDETKIKYKEAKSSTELLEKTSSLIANNFVIGWFQGHMEWGPRALGNRSILANPLHKDMQNILNEKVKHRELFRPFAPSVCKDDINNYFVCDIPVPEPTDYMLMVYPVRNEWKEKLPAITHVDGTARVQSVSKNQNPLYYNLIKKFGEISGVPILVNTSFNIRGEPIVCSPKDAYRCMMGTEIDYLVMGNFLISRAENLQDIWNPEIID